MLSVFIFFVKGIIYYLEVFFISQEISITGIYKKCFDIVLFDIMRIGFLDIEQIFVLYILFVSPVTFFYIGL